MNKADIYKTLKPVIIKHLGVDDERITLEQHIVEDLGADSIDVVELIMAIEDHYCIEIPDEDAEKLASVRLIVDYIHAHHNISTASPAAVELANTMVDRPAPVPETRPLNDNSVRIYIDNTIKQKRGYQSDKSNSIMAREKAKHQVEVLQVMREELFGSRLA